MKGSGSVVVPRTPFYIELEVTSRCNLNCKYCFAKPLRGLIPPFEQVEFLLTKTCREAKPFQIVLMGGEPFIRKDIIAVLNLTKKLFGEFGISTNGTMLSSLSQENLQTLKEVVEERTIQVSIDSLDDSINSVGRGGTTRVIRGMDALEENGVPFTAGIVVYKPNAGDLKATIRGLIARYPKTLRAINLNRLMPSKSLGADYYDLKLPPEEYVRVTSVANEIVREMNMQDVEVFIEKEEYFGRVALDELDIDACLQGITRAEVFANGDVGPCSMLRDVVVGNLFQDSWASIWERSVEMSCHTMKSTPGMLCQLHNSGLVMS